MRSSAVAIGTLTAAVVFAFPTPAHAETKVKSDRLGDAPAVIDVASARYSHGEESIKVVAQVPALGRVGEAELAISRFDIFEAGYVVRIVKRRGKPAKVRLYFFNHFDLEKRACDSVSGVWGQSSIRLKVARDCLVGHARREVFAQFGIQRGTKIDRAPAVRGLARG